MILSTGRKVVDYEQPNGSTFSEIEGGGEMTDAEYAAEYRRTHPD